MQLVEERFISTYGYNRRDDDPAPPPSTASKHSAIYFRLLNIFKARPLQIKTIASSFHHGIGSDNNNADADMPKTGTSSAQGVTIAAEYRLSSIFQRP